MPAPGEAEPLDGAHVLGIVDAGEILVGGFGPFHPHEMGSALLDTALGSPQPRRPLRVEIAGAVAGEGGVADVQKFHGHTL